ncbi:MAG: OmpA family protein [Gammaproteobacteria bacterium]
MNKRLTLCIVSVISAILSGCASTKIVDVPQPWCTIAATAIGSGVGYGVNEAVADDNQEGDSRPGAIVAGAALGAAASFLLCGEEKKPEPPPAPEPAPEPDPCALDEDGDGVNDCDDTCPSTPIDVEVDASGCPKTGEVLMRLEGVNFAFDSAKLTPESEGILDQAVQELQEAASVTVRVEGHTDSIGSEAYNLELSERRAQAVVDYLISKGIDPTRVAPQGMGEGHPVDTNDTKEGRYHNRRVDFVVTSNQ